MIKQRVHDFPTSLGNQKRRKIWWSKLLSSIDTCTFLLLLDIWKEFFILGAVMFKLSVCWVPGELRPLLGRQRVYVSWMYLWKLRLVNSSSLCSFFWETDFFRKKASTIFFLQQHENVSKSIMKFSSVRLESPIGNLPWKKIDRHTTIAFSIGVITCCFPPSHIRQAKKRGLKRNPHHHYWGIITQSSFIPDRVSGLFCASFFNGYKGRFVVVTHQNPKAYST